jgi:hypothetical protein
MILKKTFHDPRGNLIACLYESQGTSLFQLLGTPMHSVITKKHSLTFSHGKIPERGTCENQHFSMFVLGHLLRKPVVLV